MKTCKKILAALLFVASANASETVNGAKKDFENFKVEMNAKLDDVNREIEVLRGKAQSHGDKVARKTADDLEKSRDELKGQLADLEKRGNDGWKNVKSDFSDSLNRLNSKVQSALKE